MLDIFDDPLNPSKIKCSTDQSQVTERLRSVPQLLAAAGDFFREHTQVIREAKHILEQIDSLDAIPGLVNTRPRHGLDEPKGAHAKGTFATAYTYYEETRDC
jgi:hypothetical protein